MNRTPEFFEGVGPITYAGPESDDPMSFRWYDADRVVAGRGMDEQLRMAVCFWHSFVWPGSDVFGEGTLDRPWTAFGADPLESPRLLWGGREGYETLLNTDLAREEAQLAQLLHLVVEHKYRIGFEGAILTEPKPAEPTKHQYDHDVATVSGFVERHGMAGEVRLNLEANHVTLAGHSFHHEVATAAAAGLLGSVDANRGDPQNGWDTDQFPNSVEEFTIVLYEILVAGCFTTGGINFDTKLRRQSVARHDLFYGHIGAMDTLAGRYCPLPR